MTDSSSYRFARLPFLATLVVGATVLACANQECCPCAERAGYVADLATIEELRPSVVENAGAEFYLAAVVLDDCLAEASGYIEADP